MNLIQASWIFMLLFLELYGIDKDVATGVVL